MRRAIALMELKPATAKSLLRQDWQQRSWKNHDMAKAALHRMGFQLLGVGSYSTVWGQPGDPYVVKLVQDDPCFLRFAQYCNANRGNPHVPRMGRVMRWPGADDGEGMVFTERLRPLKLPLDLYHQMERYLNAQRRGRPRNADDLVFAHEHPRLARTLDELAAIFAPARHCDVDLGPSNFMQRGDGVIVITDPFSTNGKDAVAYGPG
jgi:hypothetical protein